MGRDGVRVCVRRIMSTHVTTIARDFACLLTVPSPLAGPLGKPIHYVWPRARDDFWPGSVTTAGVLGGAEKCNVDFGLTDALKLGREVLFAADDSAKFIAISSRMDEQVHLQLFGRRAQTADEHR